ncbi:MAG: Fe-S cluster assembly ATPase SufC [Bacilli bacterium]|nr:Fe-S cluster assembly ATPase SufC [Bacilli bacterium]
MKKLLQVSNLHAGVENKEILKGLNLEINPGEIHVIMGPNGTGKSTLSSVIMGDPSYTVTKGTISYNEKDLLEMSVDERAREGVFLAMQYPSELSGVNNLQFLKTAINAKREENDPIKLLDFYKQITKTKEKLKMKEDYAERFVNVGFSGGEKKRNEIFQMILLEPKLIILDEIDSGLDIDAIKIVGENIMEYYMEHKEETGIIIITHYPRLLEYIKPDFVHIIKEGVIVKTGDASLAMHLEETGYDEI